MAGNVLMKGKQDMRQSYARLFSNVPELHCELKSRIIQGNTIIDQERVTGFNDKALEAVAIYTVEGGKIVKVHFIQ
jgi:hypothetical protein